MRPLANRGVGAVPLLQDLLPAAALDGLAVLTWLGSVPIIAAIVVAAYWFGPRDRGAVGIAAVIAAIALTVGLKAAFGLPRPPAQGQWLPADGFGFPSGHAIAATVGWGVIAHGADRGTPAQRAGAAAVVVGIVAVSRVALGVHYAVDVVAGVAVGLGVLAAAVRLSRPTRAFGLAAVVAVVAAVVSGGRVGALLLVGGAVAGAVLWPRLAVPSEPWSRAGLVPAVAVGGGVAVLLAVAVVGDFGGAVGAAVGAVAVAAVLGAPAVFDGDGRID